MIDARAMNYRTSENSHIVDVRTESTIYQFTYVERDDDVLLTEVSIDGDVLTPGREIVEAEGAARRMVVETIDEINSVAVPDTATIVFG